MLDADWELQEDLGLSYTGCQRSMQMVPVAQLRQLSLLLQAFLSQPRFLMILLSVH